MNYWTQSFKMSTFSLFINIFKNWGFEDAKFSNKLPLVTFPSVQIPEVTKLQRYNVSKFQIFKFSKEQESKTQTNIQNIECGLSELWNKHFPKVSMFGIWEMQNLITLANELVLSCNFWNTPA